MQRPICRLLFVLRTKHPWYYGDCIDQGSGEQKPSSLCLSEEFHVVAWRKKEKRRNVRPRNRGRWNDLGVDLSFTFAPFYPGWPKSALDQTRSQYSSWLLSIWGKMVRQMVSKRERPLPTAASRQCNYDACIVWTWILSTRQVYDFIFIISWYVVIVLIVISYVCASYCIIQRTTVVIRLAGGIHSL